LPFEGGAMGIEEKRMRGLSLLLYYTQKQDALLILLIIFERIRK
jgi:hypothetical protein